MKLENELQEFALAMFDRSIENLSDKECYVMLLNFVKNNSPKQNQSKERKTLLYFRRILIGKLLSNNLINLKIYHEVKDILEKTENLSPRSKISN